MTRWIVLGALLTTASGCSFLPGMSSKKSNAPSNAAPPSGQPASAPGQEEKQPGDEKPQPSGPVVVSVSLKNECKETVKLFFGDKPKFGSGTYSSLGSNTRTSKQMQEGDMIWLVDDSQNGIASVTISSGTRNVEIVKSCDGIVPR